jgi:C4-dicarboxylate-specific signal transduction histidine kinase
MAGGVTMLERVLFNLMVNASEGDGTRGATNLWLHAYREEGRVTIWIEDDGPGFPDAMLGEPLAHTGTSKSDGNGMGLYVVREAVQLSNGAVTLLRRPGGGATVRLSLPGEAG